MFEEPTQPRQSKIVTAIQRIKNALAMCPPLPASEFKQKIPQPGILSHLIFIELEEMVMILLMLEESRQRAASYNEQIEQILNASTDLEPELIASFRNETKKLTIHIKTLYEWLYHLQNLIKSNKTIRQLVSQEQWTRLDADCEFRGAFIAHKKQFDNYAADFLDFDRTFERIKLSVTTETTLSITKNIVKELDTLYKQCNRFINDKRHETNDFHEKYRILSANLHRVTDENLRRQAVAFFRKYGASSRNIVDIAEFVAELAESLLPNLIALKPN